MTAENLAPFFIREPFHAFIMYLVDGRVFEVPHPDFVFLERTAAGIWYFHKAGELEMIDPRSIVSIKTKHSADFDQFIR